MAYEPAYREQVAAHARVLSAREGGRAVAGELLLVEHEPVITVSNRPGAHGHLLATAETLEREGVRVAPTDRGGDITYHGPGQLVVYPTLDLNHLNLGLHDYMRFLEDAAIEVCAGFGLTTRRDPRATGVWTAREGAPHSKICAMGVRVRRWVSMHGLALNVTTNLRHFDLIVPCGLAGRGVTSLEQELGADCPSMGQVKRAFEAVFARMVTERAIHAKAARA
jgi:lipoyl(octanoyl) transferase